MVMSDVMAAPLEHGRRHEQVALTKYVEDTGNAVNLSGLVVSLDFPFLAASPDGKVTRDLLVEVKCPYVSRDKAVSADTVPYLRTDESGNIFLNQTHDYFYQIQGQLLCTGASECTLIICHADKKEVNDIKYVSVFRNNEFIFGMVNKLKDFYKDYFEPALLDKLLYKPYYG